MQGADGENDNGPGQQQQDNPAARAGPPQRVRISAKEFQAKFSSKRECFTFLTIDCKAYLPAYDTVTIYFVSHHHSSHS